MERTWTVDLREHAGEQVRLAGWLHRLRQLSNVSFLVLRDGKGLAQVVVEDERLRQQLAHLHNESVLVVEGLAVATPQAPGGVEVHRPVVEVISPAGDPPPFDLYRPTLPVQLPALLDHASVGLRHPRQRALFRLAAASLDGFRSALKERDYVEVQTPKLVGSATEGGANVFAVDYLGQTAYLAQSPQLYKQIMVGVFERVFEVGRVFRAEPHDTTRHLNEYTSLDVELGFIQDHTTVMEVLVHTIRGMLAAIRAEAADALTLLGCTLPEVPDVPGAPGGVPAIHFPEALERISQATGEDVRREPDLSPAHERWLGEWALREHGTDFLFVYGQPMGKRPFYTHPDPERPEHSRSFDLLFRGLELCTGGQRLHRHEDYLAALAARGQDAAPFAGYLEAFKHGMPPHGGFAIGLERWVARLVEAPNIRETALFPRDLHRLMP
jgi:nondiscriminating aspartyl-tRNA synthetase